MLLKAIAFINSTDISTSSLDKPYFLLYQMIIENEKKIAILYPEYLLHCQITNTSGYHCF